MVAKSRARRVALRYSLGVVGGRGGGQLRRLGVPPACGGRFTSQCGALPQIGGFIDAAGGLGAGDAQPVGQYVRLLAADLGRGGLTGHPIDQLVARNGQASRRVFEALQQAQALRGGQRLKRQLGQSGHRDLQRVKDLDGLLPEVANMFESYVGPPTKMRARKPLKPK
jgi:hypothetical protein